MNSISDEDLVSKLQPTYKVTTNSKPTEIILFTNQFNIRSGNKSVSLSRLYKLLNEWTKLSISYKEFRQILIDLKFRIKEDNIYLNVEQIKISEYVYQFLTKKEQEKRNQLKIHLDNFINEYNIELGHQWIDINHIYYLYNVWIEKTKRKVLPIKTFQETLQLFFEYAYRKSIIHFKLNPSILNHLTKENIEEINKGIMWEKRKPQKKKPKEVKPNTQP